MNEWGTQADIIISTKKCCYFLGVSASQNHFIRLHEHNPSTTPAKTHQQKHTDVDFAKSQ
jgi:hypothetical protein